MDCHAMSQESLKKLLKKEEKTLAWMKQSHPNLVATMNGIEKHIGRITEELQKREKVWI